MDVVGAEVHERTHTFVAVDEVGRRLGEKVVAAARALLWEPDLPIASHDETAGDSSTEALRCLKRRLARVVFHHLHTDHHNRQTPCQPAAA